MEVKMVTRRRESGNTNANRRLVVLGGPAPTTTSFLFLQLLLMLLAKPRPPKWILAGGGGNDTHSERMESDSGHFFFIWWRLVRKGEETALGKTIKLAISRFFFACCVIFGGEQSNCARFRENEPRVKFTIYMVSFFFLQLPKNIPLLPIF